MTSRVAVVTCAGENVDPDSPLALAALNAKGFDARLVVWDDPTVQWSTFDVVVLRSTWDYAGRVDDFLTWADATPNLCNEADVVRWNVDKHYLAELERAGVPIIATSFCDRGSTPVFPDGEFVVKPAVGAGSMGADVFGPDAHDAARRHVEALHAAGRDVLIQPYVRDIDEDGELALVFIGGEFSHAMRKGAMLRARELDRTALFRAEQMSRRDAPPEALALAARLFAACPFDNLLYARVDLVPTPQGWALMEFEVTEPSLFLTHVPEAATRLADAVARRVR